MLENNPQMQDLTKSIETFRQYTDFGPRMVRPSQTVGVDPITQQPFTIDAAYLPARSRHDSLLIMVGSDHGNEGTFGTQVIEAFNSDLVYELGDNTGIFQIHTTNPGGFFYGTREDEHGRDPMRCFIYDWEQVEAKLNNDRTQYIAEKLDPLFNPKETLVDIDQDAKAFKKSLFGMMPLLFEYSLEEIYGSAMGGAYSPDRKGNLFYGCDLGEKTPVVEFFENTVIPVASGYKKVRFVTYHTGIGSKKGCTIIANRRSENPRAFSEVGSLCYYAPGHVPLGNGTGISRTLNGFSNMINFGYDIITTERSLKLDAVGSVESFLFHWLMDKGNVEEVTAVTHEGTTPGSIYGNFLSLKQRHQAHKNGSSPEIKHQTRQTLIDRFVPPSDPAWQEKTIGVAVRGLASAIKQFNLDGASKLIPRKTIYSAPAAA